MQNFQEKLPFFYLFSGRRKVEISQLVCNSTITLVITLIIKYNKKKGTKTKNISLLKIDIHPKLNSKLSQAVCEKKSPTVNLIL